MHRTTFLEPEHRGNREKDDQSHHNGDDQNDRELVFGKLLNECGSLGGNRHGWGSGSIFDAEIVSIVVVPLSNFDVHSATTMHDS